MLSIITPNLNNAKYLEDNILAIKSLSISFEHIIVDGGSTDGSLELIAKYPHLKLLKQTEKTGMYGAIHQGFTESTGEFIGWVNADDRIIKDGFEKMYKEILENKYDFIYSDGKYDFIKENRQEIIKGKYFGKFFLKRGIMPFLQPSSLYTKKLYNEVGGLRFEKFKICGDLDLFLRMAQSKKAIFKYLKTSSIIFTKRGDSLGDLNNDLYLKEIKDNNIPKPNFLVRILFFIFKFI